MGTKNAGSSCVARQRIVCRHPSVQCRFHIPVVAVARFPVLRDTILTDNQRQERAMTNSPSVRHPDRGRSATEGRRYADDVHLADARRDPAARACTDPGASKDAAKKARGSRSDGARRGGMLGDMVPVKFQRIARAERTAQNAGEGSGPLRSNPRSWWWPDRRQRDAAEAVEIDYEPLPCVVDTKAAIAPAAPLPGRGKGRQCV